MKTYYNGEKRVLHKEENSKHGREKGPSIWTNFLLGAHVSMEDIWVSAANSWALPAPQEDGLDSL